MEFPGDDDDIDENRATHNFSLGDRCFDCDARRGGVTADWPCGADVPREVVNVDA
jgi:hypothetical protein